MAITSNNMLTRNYSGKIGGQFVMRSKGGKSIIAALPKPSFLKEQYQARREEIKRSFNLAVIYASKAIKNPELKAQYEAVRRNNQSAFNVAFLDKYFAPELSDLRTESYTGQAGQQLQVQAIDNFRVTKVLFTLFAPDGSLLEEGEAQMDDNGFDWNYTTQVQNPSPTGTIVRVIAEDVPKGRSILEGII